MAARHSMVTVGRISGLHGVRGWVRIHSYTDPPANIADYQPWRLERGGTCEPVVPLETKRHGRGLIARLQGIDDRDRAAPLVGALIRIDRAQLPPVAPGQYYWADLVGLEVVTVDGASLGVIERLFDTGANDVMVVRGESERLIPWITGQVVRDVDLETARVTVAWDPEF